MSLINRYRIRVICAASLFLIPLFLVSCYKIESGTYIYTPTFSLPIGTINTTFEDVLPEIHLYPAPTDTSRIDSIPVLLYNDNLYYTTTTFDTVYYKNFNFQNISEELEMAEEIVFRINYTNYFPTEVAGQVYFQNGIGIVVDSLLPDGPYQVASAQIDRDGQVIAPTIDQIEVPFSRDRINNLYSVERIAIHIHIHLVSGNDEIIKFYSDQCFEMQIGLRVSINRELSQ